MYFEALSENERAVIAAYARAECEKLAGSSTTPPRLMAYILLFPEAWQRAFCESLARDSEVVRQITAVTPRP